MKLNLIIIFVSILSGCGSSGGDTTPATDITPTSETLIGTWYSPAIACSFAKKTASLTVSKSTIDKTLYTARLSYYDDTLYNQFLFDIDIKETSASNKVTTFNYSANGNTPSGGSGDISPISSLELSSSGLELSSGCAINENLVLTQDLSQVLNSSLTSHEQETTATRNAYLQSFTTEWATIYADLVSRGVAGSQSCGARASLFETYLQNMTNDFYTLSLKYLPLGLPKGWQHTVYDSLKALDQLEAQYSQYGTPCVLLPDVELYYQFLYK